MGGTTGAAPRPEAVSRHTHLILVLLGLVVVWEGLFLYAGEEALRGPVDTLRDTAQLLTTDLFWSHFGETVRAFAFALTLAVSGGIALGVWLGFDRLSSELFVPMLIGFASIPKVVLYPLVLLAFGLGFPAKVAFGAMFGIPPIALSTIGAVANIRPVLIKLGRVLGLNAISMAHIVLVPAVLPEIITGLRLGFSVTLIGTILGEMFAARRGLGYLLMTAIGLHDVTLIMSLAFVLTTLAVSASAALLTVDRRLRQLF
jgi:NitT/TauT family transport system permease protein